MMIKLLLVLVFLSAVGCNNEPEFVEPTLPKKLTSDEIGILLTNMEAEYELIQTEEQLDAAHKKLAQLKQAVAEMEK